MEEKFTIAEIKKYIESCNSFGDAAHFLSAENIRKANIPKPKDRYEIRFEDEGQGRYYDTNIVDTENNDEIIDTITLSRLVDMDTRIAVFEKQCREMNEILK